MAELQENQVIVLYLSYIGGTGGKRRPVLVVKSSSEVVRILAITSKFENKSPRIQKQYYQIKDWEKIGLTKTSWIDIKNVREFPSAHLRYQEIGKLTLQDIQGLADFIKNYEA